MSALTVRGVKQLLTRARIDYSALTIRHDPDIWTDLETGERSTSVMIKGPDEARKKAWHALMDRGLSCAPYPEFDMWSRRAAR